MNCDVFIQKNTSQKRKKNEQLFYVLRTYIEQQYKDQLFYILRKGMNLRHYIEQESKEQIPHEFT